jgi:uncharacterized protein YbjT (DUF2867 family)
MERVLVIGGTGMLGRPVAAALRAAGIGVRVVSRDVTRARALLAAEAGQAAAAGYEVVAGDVQDPASLREALRGCDGVHLNMKSGPDADLERRVGRNVAAVAAELGLQRVTYLSGASVCEQNAWFPPIRAKLDAERALQEAAAPHTIFRATWFMESLPLFVRGGRAAYFGRQPHPMHWVAAGDYARMVAAAYAAPEAAGRRLYVHGPEAMTTHAALERYCAVAHPGAGVGSVPLWIASLMGLFSGELRAVTRLMRYFERVGEGGDPKEANNMLGAPDTTLEDWARARKRAR